MDKSRIFFIFCIFFISGVFFQSFFPEIINFLYFGYFSVLLSLIILVVFYKNKTALIAVLIILSFALGCWLTFRKINYISNLKLKESAISQDFFVSQEPEAKGRMQNLILKNEKSDLKVLVSVSRYPEYKYGDKLKLNCILEFPKNFEEGFDYRMYLAKNGIYYTCKNPKITFLGSGGNIFYKTLINIKETFDKKMGEAIPFPEAGLLSGILMGGDQKLSKEIQNDFSVTGVTHIIAVSGYNVTIVAEYLMILGIYLGLWRKQSFWFAVSGIILFVIMVGFPSSAVRAGVMGILLIWAMKNGRLASSQNAVIFSAFVMLLANPLLLRYDVGFQLSFLATLGIVYFYPIINNIFAGKNKFFGLWEILLLTLSAQIFVLPVIIYKFHRLSLISPSANILVLPTIPMTMLLGFLAILFKLLYFPLAPVVSWITFLFLKYQIWIIGFLAKIKFSSVEMNNFSWIYVVLWYIISAVFIRWLKKISYKNAKE